MVLIAFSLHLNGEFISEVAVIDGSDKGATKMEFFVFHEDFS
jgi:hypothetical protein